MEEIKIHKHQLKQIQETLRMCANALKSHTRETCLDRDVMHSWNISKALLNGDDATKLKRHASENIELKGENNG